MQDAITQLLASARSEAEAARHEGAVRLPAFTRLVDALERYAVERATFDRLLAHDHQAAVARLESRLRSRRTRAGAQLARRAAPLGAAFPVLVRGADVFGGVVYGLVDPRVPETVRYVGQAIRASARMVQHLTDRSAKPRAQWIRGLLAADVAPDMVLLERVASGADLDARERYWIHALRDGGQADLNRAIPPRTAGGTAKD